MNLLPKDEKFFELFKSHSRILSEASKLLMSGLNIGYEGVRAIEEQMSLLEGEGDKVVHEIFGRLRSTFITPFDPEDIQALAKSFDDVLDYIDDVTFRIIAYRLDPIPPAVPLLGEKIHSSCSYLSQALEALRQNKPVIEFCIEVNRLENEADKIERDMLVDLFRRDMDPIALMKQKEIYEMLEATTDRCEDVADVIQNVSVKHL